MNSFKIKAQQLRSQGLTYKEISSQLRLKIAKSTLSYWCKGIALPPGYSEKVRQINLQSLALNRVKALKVNKCNRETYLEGIKQKHLSLAAHLWHTKESMRIALALLYMTEGARSNKGALTFSNSDPRIIRLFLKLIRKTFDIDESKFRCTLQCRADQNTGRLRTFWSETTGIPLSNCYLPRIDPRTVGIPTKKVDYRGVCRIDYLSGHVYNELRAIIDIIY